MMTNCNGSSHSKRDSIISRIQKLSKMTTANGCTEAEALRASELIAQLSAEYNIDESETRLKQDADGMLDDFFIVPHRRRQWERAVGAIAQLHSTRSWFNLEAADILGLGVESEIIEVHFYGYPLDVAASIAMAQLCQIAVQTEGAAWRKKNRGKLEAFEMGMGERLDERIAALAPQTHTTSQSRALIPLKGQLVREGFGAWARSQGFHFVSSNRRNPFDPNARAAGRAAADRVNLGAKISPHRLKIGRG